MTSLEADLTSVGEQLQTAWRRDARRARRQHRALLGSLAALLALTGAAFAADVLPFGLTSAGHPPAPAALTRLRAVDQPLERPLLPWQKALKLDFSKAVVIAEISGRQTGPLSVIVVPGARHGICFDAARPDGSPYISACKTLPSRQGGSDEAVALTAGIDEGFTSHGVYHPPLLLSLHTAPPHAARIDVRARDGSTVPALISHGWLVYLNVHPARGPVLVRVYDGSGERLLSYEG